MDRIVAPINRGRESRISQFSPKRHQWSLRFVALGCAMVVSSAFGSSIRLTLNSDPAICADFVKMVEMSGVGQLDAGELCTFRFTALSRDKSRGFSFPTWSALRVADPADERDRMYRENDFTLHGKEPSLLQTNTKEATRVAAAEDNLAFTTTSVKLDESLPPLTVEKMDLKRCSDTKFRQVREDGSVDQTSYMNYEVYPSFSIYWDAERQRPLPAKPTSAGGQLALWRDKKWVQLRMTHRWIRGGSPPVLMGSLMSFQYMPQVDVPYGRVKERMMSYTTCQVTITR